MTPLRVAAAQAAAVPGDLAANVATAARLVRRAGDAGARVVVLPEAFLVGYDAPVLAGPLPTPADATGPLLDPVREACRETGTTALVGVALDRGATRTLSLLLARPDGEVVAAYDKQHLDGDEKQVFTTGDAGASVRVDGHELGLAVCYDACFPEHARAAATDGALGYLVSAAWFRGGEHRRDLHHAARAVENGSYVVMAGLTGRCGSSEFSGGSAVHDPEGRPLARLGTEEGVAVADLDPAVVASTRARHTMLADHRAGLGGRRRV
ncbi:carbon-nitrogen hydrolase family protein [Nocardioides sp. ChNu-153]|uniref:carbon-nitrogen hydrolase family protein n=1 Tax=unclassified Nocardioides TaxID=2615069 RepID=UPI00240602CF|nr:MULTISPECIES: carbon-nitrogen hydrolase family protein [unclassified Nocardioides]MDN7120074.1 carbon-nitrogen hydrolase family protein [Nocardioides sp. ChNu-153]